MNVPMGEHKAGRKKGRERGSQILSKQGLKTFRNSEKAKALGRILFCMAPWG